MNFADSQYDDLCPHCGSPLPPQARLCRECGASEEYAWGDAAPDDADYEAEDDFDYDDFVAREFPDHAEHQAFDPRKMWIGVVILAIVISMLIGSVL